MGFAYPEGFLSAPIPRFVTEEISKTSRLVSKITGMVVQPNKAIVGANAFAHTSGIHQDGLLKEKTTYEIMRPESIGLTESKMVMGKLSGRHAFRQRLVELGYTLRRKRSTMRSSGLKNWPIRRRRSTKRISKSDRAVPRRLPKINQQFVLTSLIVESGQRERCSDCCGRTGDRGAVRKASGSGDGPVENDGLWRRLRRYGNEKPQLTYSVKAITGGWMRKAKSPFGGRGTAYGDGTYGADTAYYCCSREAYLNGLRNWADRVVENRICRRPWA